LCPEKRYYSHRKGPSDDLQRTVQKPEFLDKKANCCAEYVREKEFWGPGGRRDFNPTTAYQGLVSRESLTRIRKSTQSQTMILGLKRRSQRVAQRNALEGLWRVEVREKLERPIPDVETRGIVKRCATFFPVLQTDLCSPERLIPKKIVPAGRSEATSAKKKNLLGKPTRNSGREYDVSRSNATS